jgi:hypothetical protein
MAAGLGSMLRPGAVLVVDDSKLGEIDIALILADPSKYEGEACADPIEGVSYGGTTTAKNSLAPGWNAVRQELRTRRLVLQAGARFRHHRSRDPQG